jgi:hypothetical protein
VNDDAERKELFGNHRLLVWKKFDRKRKKKRSLPNLCFSRSSLNGTHKLAVTNGDRDLLGGQKRILNFWQKSVKKS